MEGGRIVEDGSPAELRANPATRYAQMLATDATLHARLASDATWRRVQIQDGAIVSIEAGEA
jgi:ABC-type proline/glycine betaine transport system ATPase subunit